MGLFTGKHVNAGCRPEQGCADDLQAAQEGICKSGRRGFAASLALTLLAGPLFAETLRIATFSAPLSRDGPGLLLRDLGREDAQIEAVLAIIEVVGPDVLLLTDFDYDLDQIALGVFAQRAGYSYHFAAQPNTGLRTDQDLDQNGKYGEPRDAQGYGRFSGDGGMAVLSRWPIDAGGVQDFSDLLWKDLPGATLPEGWPDTVNDIQRLSTAGHWVVPIKAEGGVLNLLAFAATPPVFDGPEDRNGLRNRDELRLWNLMLDGHFGAVPGAFIIAGNANLDPVDGQGISPAMSVFLSDARLQDPMPKSRGAALVDDPRQRGDPAMDTADWEEVDGPGNLRVSYVLPSTSWDIADAGVFWPAPDKVGAELLGDDGLLAGPHRLVWVDVRR